MSNAKENISNTDLKKEISQLREEIANLKSTKSLIDNTNLADSIFEDAGIGMAIIDKNFKLAKYNQTFNNLFGYNHEELVNMTYLDLIQEENRIKAVQLFEAMFASKLSKYQTEQVYLRKDKSFLWFKLTASVIRNKNGEPEYILGVGEDITETKRQESIRNVVF